MGDNPRMTSGRAKLCCAGGALPYQMGNAGDLLKHGMLAEFVRWRRELSGASKPFCFLDPFGGLPHCGDGEWCGGKKIAIERFKRLANECPDCALVHAQCAIPRRYYGSGGVVFRAAKGDARIRFSDCCESKRKLLAKQPGFEELKALGFDPRDGYSVLNSINQGCIDGDLVLIDPFGDFLPCRQDDVAPRIAEASRRMAVVLFVLNKNPENKIGRKWRRAKETFFQGAWALSYLHPPHSDVLGESGYSVEVVLSAQCLREANSGRVRELHERLHRFKQAFFSATGIPALLEPKSL